MSSLYCCLVHVAHAVGSPLQCMMSLLHPPRPVCSAGRALHGHVPGNHAATRVLGRGQRAQGIQVHATSTSQNVAAGTSVRPIRCTMLQQIHASNTLQNVAAVRRASESKIGVVPGRFALLGCSGTAPECGHFDTRTHPPSRVPITSCVTDRLDNVIHIAVFCMPCAVPLNIRSGSPGYCGNYCKIFTGILSHRTTCGAASVVLAVQHVCPPRI